MSRLRRKPTLVDLTVMALSPALVMLMVGSLVFFLVEVLYAGQYTARLLWTLGYFVFAAVLLARVAIEVGVDRARLLGGLLAVVTYVALAAYVRFPEGSMAARFAWAINLLLMAVIWFAADRLTWDCTYVDDKRQASDMGLLLASGLATDPAAASAASTASTLSTVSNADQPDQRKQPHTPGLWVVWFALAAVPLFGLLGSLIPASEPERRRYAVLLVGCYLVAALGLLLTTSFLGVRQYLRQRDVSMPRSMTGIWLGVGGVLVAVMVLVAMVLPRPYSEYALLRLPPLGSQQDRQASSNALNRDSAGKGDGRPGEKVDAKGQVSDQPGKDGKGHSKDGKDGQAQSKDNGQGDQGSGSDDASSQSSQGSGGSQSGGSQSGKSAAAQQGQPSSSPQSPPTAVPGSLAQLAELVRWLVFIVGVLAVVGLVVWWLISQLGRSPRTVRVSVADTKTTTPVRRATFADYADPFATGLAESKPLEEVVAYSFEALQAWANDHNAARRPDETALEFATRLGETHVRLQTVMRELAALSSRAAFAAGRLDNADLAVVRRFWRELASEAGSAHTADASD